MRVSHPRSSPVCIVYCIKPGCTCPCTKKAMHITYKYVLFLVACSGVGAATQWYCPQGWPTIEVVILSLGIFLTGIPHGAMDHFVARQQAVSDGKIFRIRQFITTYILWILLYTLVWWIAPGFSLILFLLLSAWHFGETDFKFAGAPGRWKSVKTLLYGIGLVAWLLLSHAVELQYWIEILLPAGTSASVAITRAGYIPPYLFFIIAAGLLLPVNSKKQHKWLIWLFFSGFLFLCGKMSLLSGFALYFTGWHGVLAFVDINNYLPLQGKLLAVWRTSMPLSVLSYVFLLFIYLFTDAGVWQNAGLPAIFILLSVLTLPHVQVMHRLYRRVETV